MKHAKSFQSLLFRLPNIDYRLICPAVLVESIHAKIQDANSKLFKNLYQIKAQKLDQLIGPQITSDSSPENLKTVVTIPENLLLLSDSEKSFLSKGLNFVPISKRKPTNLKLSKTLKNPFPAFTKFSNLSLEEWSALKSVKKTQI